MHTSKTYKHLKFCHSLQWCHWLFLSFLSLQVQVQIQIYIIFQEKHKKDSRLKCQHCGHHYLRKDNLDAHIRSAHVAQTGSDVTTNHVAKCQLCDKTYGNENNLSDHMRTCHGILPWNVLPKKNGEELDMDRLKLELAGSVKVPTQSYVMFHLFHRKKRILH